MSRFLCRLAVCAWKRTVALSLWVALSLGWPASLSAQEAAPVKVLFDTDMDTDCDDAGALAMLHAFADHGEVEILATTVSSRYQWSAPTVDAINTYYGRPDLPIGVPKGEGATLDRQYRYPKQIAEAFPHDLPSNDAAPSAVDVYRRVLAAAPDDSVVLVTVGYLTNVRDFLASEPDEHSPLSGIDLARRKVKRWVCMGGRYPHELDPGQWGNFKPDAAAAVWAARVWPGHVVFSGLGTEVLTGAGLAATPETNPVRRAYELYLGDLATQRPSWDQTALLYAVRGTADFFEIERQGYNHLFSNGTNVWRPAPDDPRHVLLRRTATPEHLANVIEALMVQPPHSGEDR